MKWNNIILNYLPSALRTIGIFNLLKVLVKPLYDLYDKFVEVKTDASYKASITPSVASLKYIISKQCGTTVDINESTGKPYDFIVVLGSDDTDKADKIKTLVQAYKMAGKTFKVSDDRSTISYELIYGYPVITIHNVELTRYYRTASDAVGHDNDIPVSFRDYQKLVVNKDGAADSFVLHLVLKYTLFKKTSSTVDGVYHYDSGTEIRTTELDYDIPVGITNYEIILPSLMDSRGICVLTEVSFPDELSDTIKDYDGGDNNEMGEIVINDDVYIE